jgi:hypothetical protein
MLTPLFETEREIEQEKSSKLERIAAGGQWQQK